MGVQVMEINEIEAVMPSDISIEEEPNSPGLSRASSRGRISPVSPSSPGAPGSWPSRSRGQAGSPERRNRISITSNSSRNSSKASSLSGTLLEVLSELRSERSVVDEEGNLSDCYSEKGVLGEGAFAVVNEVVQRSSKVVYASKTVALSDQHEVALVKRLTHPCVVRLHEVIREDDRLRLVMDLCLGGDLQGWIQDRKEETQLKVYTTPKTSLVQGIAAQVLSAVAYIHHHKICHRDIKPANFLLTSKLPEGMLKLTDFNLACFYKEGEYMHQDCGTLSFVAPEVLDRKYTALCDVWSAGMTIYTVVCGRTSYPTSLTDDEVKRLINSCHDTELVLQDRRFEQHPQELLLLLQQLLVTEAGGRITAKRAANTKWLKIPGHSFSTHSTAESDRPPGKGCCVVS